MGRWIPEALAMNRKSAIEAYELLREFCDPRVGFLIDALEQAHLASLQTLDTASELMTTIELNSLALAERNQDIA